MPAARICEYAGIVSVPIRTFDAAYNDINGPWNFSPNAMQPMDFGGWLDAVNNPTGCQGTVFDNVKGETSFIIGSPSGTVNSNFGSLMWVDNRLRGFINFDPNHKIAYGIDVACFLGLGISIPSLPLQTLDTYPPGANTQTPNPGSGQNYVIGAGIYSSGERSLTPEYLTWPPNTLSVITSTALNLGFTGGDPLDAIQTTGGQNYARQGLTLHETNFTTTDVQFSISWENPPGGFDLNAYMTGLLNQYFNIVYPGWLAFVGTTETIAGVSLPGFGILMKPDFSKYVIVQIQPVDNTSKNWNSEGNPVDGKFDKNGFLFLKQRNDAHTIFVATEIIPIFRNLPVFPPIALPDAMPDADETLNLYRG